jgi:hypothetical protein
LLYPLLLVQPSARTAQKYLLLASSLARWPLPINDCCLVVCFMVVA